MLSFGLSEFSGISAILLSIVSYQGTEKVEKHQVNIDIASYGWQGTSWQGFYPADLPEDWRLDYYSNEFNAVVIPVELWQGASVDEIEQWQDAVHGEFRFYFEHGLKHLPSREELEAIDLLGAQWGGWISQTVSAVGNGTPSTWYEETTEPRRMREVIEQLHQDLGRGMHGVIVVNGANAPWEVASDMRQLVELMGYG